MSWLLALTNIYKYTNLQLILIHLINLNMLLRLLVLHVIINRHVLIILTIASIQPILIIPYIELFEFVNFLIVQIPPLSEKARSAQAAYMYDDDILHRRGPPNANVATEPGRAPALLCEQSDVHPRTVGLDVPLDDHCCVAVAQ